MKLNKIDLSNLIAIGHADDHLELLVDRGDAVEYLEVPAPLAAYEGLHHLEEAIAPEPSRPAPEIVMQPVDSTMARSLGYDANHNILQIEFQNGAVYQYQEIDPETWDALQTTHSKGQFFNYHIKGIYPVQRLDDAC